jgi:hypothetical protein
VTGEFTAVEDLKASDRCDRCSARALVRVSAKGSVLDFCSHHFEKMQATLLGKGFFVTEDKRESS